MEEEFEEFSSFWSLCKLPVELVKQPMRMF